MRTEAIVALPASTGQVGQRGAGGVMGRFPPVSPPVLAPVDRLPDRGVS